MRRAASAAERLDYDYPDDELRGLAAEAVRHAYRVRNTHIIFNNCDEDKGQRNAPTPATARASASGLPAAARTASPSNWA